MKIDNFNLNGTDFDYRLFGLTSCSAYGKLGSPKNRFREFKH